MDWMSAHLHQAPPIAFFTILHSLPVDPCIGLQLVEVLQAQGVLAEKTIALWSLPGIPHSAARGC